jgi:hypothetical protein
MQQGSGHALVLIASDGARDRPSRQLALVLLKQHISRNIDLFSEADKNEIRRHALQGLAEANVMLQTAFGMVLAAIAKFDGKETWVFLFNALLTYLHSGNETLVRGTVKCFSLFADYFDDETLPMVAPGLFPPLVYILSNPTTFNSPLRQQAANILFSCVEICSYCSGTAIGTMANLTKEVLPQWVDMLLPGLDSSLCRARGLEEMGVHIETIKIFGVITRTMSDKIGRERKDAVLLSVCNYFRSLAKPYLNAVVLGRTDVADDALGPQIDWAETAFDEGGNEIGTEAVMVQTMQFFISMMDGDRKVFKRFYKSGALPLLLDILVEILCITSDQVAQWDDSPDEYVSHEDESTVGNSVSVRNTAKSLVDSIALIFGRFSTCEHLINNQLPKVIEASERSHSQQQGDWWQIREGLLTAISIAFGCDHSGEHRVRALVNSSGLETILKSSMAIPPANSGFNYGNAEFLYLCAQSISCYSALLLSFSPQQRAPFLMNICAGLNAQLPMPIGLACLQAVASAVDCIEGYEKESFLPPAVEGVCRMLAISPKDTLHFTMATLSILLCDLKEDFVCRVEPTVTPLLIQSWSNHANDVSLVLSIVDVFKQLAKSSLALPGIVQRALPTFVTLLHNFLRQQSCVVEAALDMLHVIIGSYEPPLTLPKVYIEQVYPLTIEIGLKSEDNAIVLSCSNCLESFVHVSASQIAASGNGSGLNLLLSVISRLLSQETSEGAALSVGNLVSQVMLKMQGMLTNDMIKSMFKLLVAKLCLTGNRTFRQNLIMCFVRVFHVHGPLVLNLLANVNVQIVHNGQAQQTNALTALLTIWIANQESFQGKCGTKISLLAMAKIAVGGDVRVLNLIVPGDLNVNLNEGRRTRSSRHRTGQGGDEFTYKQVPWPLRAFQILARSIDNNTEEEEDMWEEGSDGEDEFEDEEEYGEMLLSDMIGDNGKSVFCDDSDDDDETNEMCYKDDALYNSDLQAELTLFFQAFARNDSVTFSQCASTLNIDEQRVLKDLVDSRTNE